MIARKLRLSFFATKLTIIWIWLVVIPKIDDTVVTAFYPIQSTTTTTPISNLLSSPSPSPQLSPSLSFSKIHPRSTCSCFRSLALLNVATNPIRSKTDSSKPQRKANIVNGSISTGTNDVTDNKKESDKKVSETTTVDDDNCNAGVVGDWENLHGNWVLRPTSSSSNNNDSEDNDSGVDNGTSTITPRAVIHFLGGALVGKAPHITYRFLLEKLADEGFLIVATPYNLSFDHLATCDDVLTKFEGVAPTLARQYGALPVVGIGHSCGALLQVLISCLFPDTPRAANALISFNNKPITEAVPFFEDFFAPVFSSLATQPGGGTGTNVSKPVRGPSSNDSLVLGLKLAKEAAKGKLPSDDLLDEAQRMFTAKVAQSPSSSFPLLMNLPIPIPPPSSFFSSLFGADNNNKDEQEDEQQQQQSIKISAEIRDTYTKWAEPTVTALNEAGLLPVIHETIVTLEQIPRLIDEVADGARDFNPTPEMVRSAAGKAYRARRTLILGYDDDPIDESDEVEEVLREARSITRMRRPMVEIDVQRKSLSGGHAAPLLAPPSDLAGRAEDLLGLETSQERLGYREAAATVEDLVRWLDEGNL